MFKEIVQFVHRTAHRFCLARPTSAPTYGGCRPAVRNGFWANLIFFIAIFTPLYVCLLKDVFNILRDFNYKIVRDNN